MSQKTIAVCMIVKDEEACLEECLRQVKKFADEIVVADTGSGDGTPEIAARYADVFWRQEWREDFAEARNRVFARARCDYLLSLDADEYISDADAAKLCALKETLRDEQTVNLVCVRPEFGTKALQPRMVRRQEPPHSQPNPSAREKDVSNHKELPYSQPNLAAVIPYWYGRVHERLIYREPVLDTDIEFVHRCRHKPDYGRNVRIMRKLPEGELAGDYWLMAQLFLDCCLAGNLEADRERLLSLMERNDEPFSEKIPVTQLIAEVLKNRGKQEDVRALSQMLGRTFRRQMKFQP